MSRPTLIPAPITTLPIPPEERLLREMFKTTADWAVVTGSASSAGVTTVQSTPDVAQIENVLLADTGSRLLAEVGGTLDLLERQLAVELGEGFRGLTRTASRDQHTGECTALAIVELRPAADPDRAFAEYERAIALVSDARHSAGPQLLDVEITLSA